MESIRRISTLLSFGVAVIAADLLAAIPRSGDSSPSDQPEAGVEVWVYNGVEVPEGDLKRARRVASEIFRVIGVKTVWREVPVTERQLRQHPPDQHPLLPQRHSDIAVRILPGPAASVVKAGPGTDELVSGGWTLASAHCPTEGPATINIFLDRMERVAEKEGLLKSLPELLGAVVADEIGRALLGPNSHSAQGMVRRHWGPEELRLASHSQLRFTAEEAEIVRDAARSRNRRSEPCQAEATESVGP